MDFLRRNTDYALRLMVNLAMKYNEPPISAKILSIEAEVSHQLSSKLLQKLTKAGLVRSTMGVNGGFLLNVDPRDISLLDVIEVIQGSIALNRCLLNKDLCSRSATCPITVKLKKVQEKLEDCLRNVCLGDLIENSVEKPVGKVISESISGNL